MPVSDEKPPASMTATEVLVGCMEGFGDCEPEKIIVIYTDASNSVVIKSNARRCEAIGMLEYGKWICMAAQPTPPQE